MPSVRSFIVATGLTGALLISTPAYAQVLTQGHIDYAARLVDGQLRSLIKDGTGASGPIWREPDAVTFSVGDAARTTVPSSASFLGRPGDTVWVLPQVQRAGVLWVGWNTEELSSAHVDGAVSWRLDSVSGPGDVTVFQTGVFGEPDVLFRSVDGLPDSRSIPLGTHAHGNWVFSREGSYRLTFTMSARLQGGATTQDTQSLAVNVGAAPVDAKPISTPSPTPPASTPTPTPGTASRPSDAGRPPLLRALSAVFQRRVLRVRLRLDRSSTVAITLRRGGRTSARAKPRTVQAGTRTVRLQLDRRPAAGRHTVRITATSDGRSVTRTLRVR